MTAKDDRLPITLRIPPKLHSGLQAAARSASHSMNAEIIARLEASFDTSANSVIIRAFSQLLTKMVSERDEEFTKVVKQANEALLRVSSLTGDGPSTDVPKTRKPKS